MNIGYYLLIGEYFYRNNNVLGKIIDIEELKDNQYRIYLDTTPYNTINKESIIVDAKELDDLIIMLPIIKERKSILNKHNINNLYHITPIDNLESIFKYGIVSGEYLDLYELNPTDSGFEKYDFSKDYVSLSLEHTDCSIVNINNSYDFNKRFVIIEIDKNILLSKLDTMFITNKEPKDYTSNEALELLYKRDNDLNLKISYPTRGDSLVLVKGELPVNYIKKIYTYNTNDKVKALANKHSINYGTNKKLFKPRKEY